MTIKEQNMKFGANKFVVCLFCICMAAAATPRQAFGAPLPKAGKAQQTPEKTVTLNVTQRTLVYILSQIKDQTGLAYGFKNSKDQTRNDLYSINVRRVSVDSALNTLFRGTRFTYDIVGNLMVNPLKWLSVGGSFIKGKGCAVATSDISPDINVGDSYTRNRWAAGLKIKLKQLDLRSEYLAGKDGSVKSDGYYATANVHLISDKLDFIASYDYFNKNKATDNKQTNYIAGLQWWFYPKCRLQLQYTYCDPHLGESSNLLQTQVQVRF